MSNGSALQHHFTDLKQQFDASVLGMWLFLVTEILFFGGLFTGYAVYRWKYPEAFAAGSHELDIFLGAVNTAVLISSSLSMAMAVRSSQLGNRTALVRNLILTLVFGGIFLGIKAMEYSHKFHYHLFPGKDFVFLDYQGPGVELFFSLYFAMTGLHALHMVIGMGILIVLTVQSSRGKFGKTYYTPVELTGLYWHFVDIVWIFLFPLLYLVGRH